MLLVIVAALAAVCGADKLDKSFLVPSTARLAGGSPGALLAPFEVANEALPTGSYTNDAQGVVVDAVNPGVRTSGVEPTGLGGPRTSYGSSNSKVGDAAFRAQNAFGSVGGANTRIAPGFNSFVGSEDSQADKNSGSSLKFLNDVGSENYSYNYKTENGISAGENGAATGGVEAQGGYSYKGDDGKTYSVTYTADKGGYKPHGQHLPTPPPIPEEILISLEKNAKDEAAGVLDDGSYDAQKYNDEGDFDSNGAQISNDEVTKGGAAAGGSAANLGNQANRPTSGVLVGTYNPASNAQVQGAQGFGQISGNKQSSFQSQGFGATGGSSSAAQAGSSQGQFTQNRFGEQAKPVVGLSNAQSQAQSSVSGSPAKTPTFQNQAGTNSAFSSAFSSGSGSATAFASTGSAGFGLKNDNLNSATAFGSSGQYAGNQAPSTATATAFTGAQQLTQEVNKFPNRFSETQPQGSAGASPFSSTNSQAQIGSLATSNQYIPPVNIVESTGINQLNAQGPTETAYTGSTSSAYNGITQAAVSSFPNPTQGSSQSGQFGAVPVIGQGATSTQQYQGTLYEYNKPAETLPAPGQQSSVSSGQGFSAQSASQVKPGQLTTDSRFGSQQSSSQFGSFSNTNTQSQQTQFNQKPSTVQSGSYYQQSQFGSQVVQKPQTTFSSTFASNAGSKGQAAQTAQFGQSATGSNYQQSQFGAAGSQFGQKPVTSQSSTFASTTGSKGQAAQTTQFGQSASGSKYQQSQFGAAGPQLGQKPVISQSSAFASTSGIKGQAGQTTQFGQQNQFPSSTVAPSVGLSQNAGSSSFNYVQNQQSNQGILPTKTTVSQIVEPTQVGQKPFGSLSSFQQSQLGASGSQLGQKQQTQASAFASSSSNAGDLTQKPFGNAQANLVSKYQPTKFGSVTQKPFGGSLTQTNFEQSANQLGSQSQFGLNSQSNVGNGLAAGQSLSNVQQQKPLGAQLSQTFQQSQLNQGLKPFGSSQSSVSGQSAQSALSGTQTSGGYNYQTPGSAFSSASSQGTFQQAQSAVGSNQFGVQPIKTGSAVATAQYVQPTKLSVIPLGGQTGQSFSSSTQGSTFVQPTQSAFVTSQKPSQTLSDESYQSSPFSSTPAPSFPASGFVSTVQTPTVESESFQSSPFSSTQAPGFPQRIGVVSSPQPLIVPISSIESDFPSSTFEGQKEQFGGARDPPSFDQLTGYHY